MRQPNWTIFKTKKHLESNYISGPLFESRSDKKENLFSEKYQLRIPVPSGKRRYKRHTDEDVIYYTLIVHPNCDD